MNEGTAQENAIFGETGVAVSFKIEAAQGTAQARINMNQCDVFVHEPVYNMT